MNSTRLRLTVRSFSNHDDDGNENVTKNNNWFNNQNNNFRLFGTFVCRHCMIRTRNETFYGGRNHTTFVTRGGGGGGGQALFSLAI